MDLDYLEHIKKYAIIAMFSDDDLMDMLVVKGGNVLDLIYGVAARSSIDIDLSMETEFDEKNLDVIEAKIKKVLEDTFQEAGYIVFDIKFIETPQNVTPDLKDFWGGYEIEFKVIEKTKHSDLKNDIVFLRRNALVVDPNYLYLYSNCLMSYVGDLKSTSMAQSSLANRAMEKFTASYKSDPSIRKQIDKWDDSNVLVKRLKEAIKLKVKQPELKHSEQYPHNKLKQITGSLEIFGLSPNNDGHLFTQILANDQISEIRFNYFGKQEATDAERLFQSKTLTTKDVRELWAEMQAS